jgi:hypothetical protein
MRKPHVTPEVRDLVHGQAAVNRHHEHPRDVLRGRGGVVLQQVRLVLDELVSLRREPGPHDAAAVAADHEDARRAADKVGHLVRLGEPQLRAQDLEPLERGDVLLLLERVDDGEHLPALRGHLKRVHAFPLAPLHHAAPTRHGPRGSELVRTPAFPLDLVRAAEQLGQTIARTGGLHRVYTALPDTSRSDGNRVLRPGHFLLDPSGP